MALTTGFVVMTAPPALANATGNNLFPNQTGGFQIDGDLSASTGITTAGSIDWNSTGVLPQPVTVDPIGSNDFTVLSTGSKESDYENWALNGSAGASTKADVGNIYFYSAIYDMPSAPIHPGPHQFVYLGVERLGNTGTVEYTVEFNQKTTHHVSAGNPAVDIPDRSIGDLRFKLFNTGSTGLQIGGTSSRWECTNAADQYPGSEATCDWSAEEDIPAGAISGLVNDGTIADPFPSAVADLNNPKGTLQQQQFVEVGIDLTSIYPAHEVIPGCPPNINFGQLNLRSRASTSLSSELKDIIEPALIHMPSLCGDLRIEKYGPDGTTPLPGATFSITPNPNTGVAGSTLVATDGGANDLTSAGTQAPADGVIEFFQAKPGLSYTVTETSPPPGYIGSSTPVTHTVAARVVTLFQFTNTLGSVTFLKQDDAGHALCCATFLVHRTSGGGTQADVTVTDNGTNDASSTPGTIKVDGLKTGDYTISETAAPAGYNLDSSTRTFTISANTPNPSISSAFVDPRQVGYIRIVKKLVDENGNPVTPKPDLSILDGTKFVVYQDANNNGVMDSGEASTLWPSGAATCTISGGLGYCDIGPLVLGNYRVAETVLPPWTTSAGDVNVTVTETSASSPIVVNYTNVLTPLQITLDKSGPDTANVGDTFTYTFTVTTSGPRLHGITVVDDSGLCNAGTGPTYVSGDDGDGFLEVGESWLYTCQHTVTMSDPDPLPNTATATGTDDYGRNVSDSDTHIVNILHPDVSVTKSGNGPISAGDQASFTITMTVGGETGARANNVTLHDAIPVPAGSGLTWALASPVAGCTVTSNVLDCSFGNLNNPSTRTITLVATTTSAACGTLNNTVTVAADNELASALANNTDSASIVVDCPNVTVQKTTDTPVVSAGDAIHFAIKVTNTSTSATAHGVTLSDTLPGGISWSIAGSIVTTGSVQSTSCNISSGVLSCNFGDMGPGATATVGLTAVSAPANCGVVTNTATVAATNEPASETGDNTSTASLTVNCPDVTVVKTADPSTINAGDTAKFTITVSNIGAGTARGVTFSDTLPGSITWAEDSASCSITAGVLNCDFGDMAPGASAVVNVTGLTVAADCGVLNNTVTVAATNEPAGALGNNTDSASLTINCPDVRVVKAAVVGTVNATDNAAFTITVDNHGAGAAYNVTLTDVLPDGITWSVDSQACSIAVQTLTCHFGTLASGASVTVTVSGATTVGSCPSISNTATVTASNESTATDIQDDNSSTATITVNCPDVRVVKAPVDASINVGDDASFTITVDNHGAGAAYGVVLTDALPSGITWTNSSLAGCSIAGGTLTCDLGTLAAGASVSVTVTGPTVKTTCPTATIDNTAVVTSTNESPDLRGDNTSTASITVNCPGLAITKTADAAVVDAGNPIGFTITMTNNGPGDAYGANITDVVPLGAGINWSVDSQLAEGQSCNLAGDPLTLTCTFGTLPVGQSVTVHISSPTTTASCATYTNVATAGAANDPVTSDPASTRVRCPLEIGIVKGGPDLAHVGDTITYTFAVTNTGLVDLVDATVTDPICDAGTLTQTGFGTGGDTILSIGETWNFTCTRVIQASDPDPLPNTATALGHDVEGRSTTAQSSWTVDIIHPAISIVKTVDNDVPTPGDTVTFSYLVTNTGDTTLFNVAVTDDILGNIGTIAQLAVGESQTLTATEAVTTSTPTTNVGTATGVDILQKQVTASDNATITITIVTPPVPPTPKPPIVNPPPPPNTGAAVLQPMTWAFALMLFGALSIAASRRRVREMPATPGPDRRG